MLKGTIMHEHTSAIEQRRSLRLDMEKELIGLEWQCENGNIIKRQAMCIDVSNGGLKVNIDRPINTEKPVKVTFRDKQGTTNSIYAKVIRETEVHDWFDVAMEFVEQVGDK
jgi:hypothetical protein